MSEFELRRLTVSPAAVPLANPEQGRNYLEYIHDLTTFLPLPSGSKAPPPIGWTAMTPDRLAALCQNHQGNFGVVPDNLLIIDIDIKKNKDGLELLAEREIVLPRTLTVATPSGGLHLYYRRPPNAQNLRLQAWASRGVEARSGRSGYVVAPGGRLSDGGRYKVVVDAAIAACPAAVVALFETPRPQVERGRASRVTLREDALRVAELLREIDPNSEQLRARADWLAILMAVATLLGPAGEALAETWSRRWKGQHATPPAEVYRSLKPDGSIGLGTLVHWRQWATPARDFDPDADREEFDRAMEEACAGLPSLDSVLPTVAAKATDDKLIYEPWWDRSQPDWSERYRERLAAVGLSVDEPATVWECRPETFELVAASAFRHWGKRSRYALWADPATWTQPLDSRELSIVLGLWPKVLNEKGGATTVDWDRVLQSTRHQIETVRGECTMIGRDYERRVVAADGYVYVNRFLPAALPGWQALERRSRDPRPADPALLSLWRKQLTRLAGEHADLLETSLAHGLQSWWYGHEAMPRLGYAIVLHSYEQGLGKSDVVNLLGTVLRGNNTLVQNYDASTGLSRFSMSSLFAAGLIKIEEIDAVKRDLIRVLKLILTDDDDNRELGLAWRTIEKKFANTSNAPYVPPMVIGTTNHLEDLGIEDIERRLLVLSAPPPPDGWEHDAREFHERVMGSLSGRVEVLTHLLRLDVSRRMQAQGLDGVRAPVTEATRRAIEAGEPTWRSLLAELLDRYDLDQSVLTTEMLTRELSLRGELRSRLPRGAVEWLGQVYGLKVAAARHVARSGRVFAARVVARPAVMARRGLVYSPSAAGSAHWAGPVKALLSLFAELGLVAPDEG